MDEAQTKRQAEVRAQARLHAADLGFDHGSLEEIFRAQANITKALELIGFKPTDSGAGFGAADIGGNYNEFRVEVRIKRKPS